MDNYKKQILQRVIDFYIEKSDADKKTIRTVACLMNDIEAINYTRCCTELKDLKDDNFEGYTIVDIKGGQIILHKGEIYTPEFINEYNKMK